MTATLANAKAILEADSANLVLLATGGIYDWDETGRMGINRNNAATSAAFGTTTIKPCLLLKLRTSVPFGGVADDSLKVVSAREMLEVWAYQDNGYSTCKAMLDRVYTLLQGQPLGGYVCRWALSIQPTRDMEMDANVERSDFAVIVMRS